MLFLDFVGRLYCLDLTAPCPHATSTSLTPSQNSGVRVSYFWGSKASHNNAYGHFDFQQLELP